MKTTTHSVSANTLMNVRQALDHGGAKTGPEIAASIHRDYSTVYRALNELLSKGTIDCVRRGRHKFYSKKQPQRAPRSSSRLTQVQDIQRGAREMLLQNGSMPLIDIVKALPYPRSTCYMVLAEMRRSNTLVADGVGRVRLVQAVLSMPEQIEAKLLQGHSTGVPAPSATWEADVAEELLLRYIKRLAEKAIKDTMAAPAPALQEPAKLA